MSWPVTLTGWALVLYVATCWMPQRDEVDHINAGKMICVAKPGEVAVMNKNGLCEVHQTLTFAQGQILTTMEYPLHIKEKHK